MATRTLTAPVTFDREAAAARAAADLIAREQQPDVAAAAAAASRSNNALLLARMAALVAWHAAVRPGEEEEAVASGKAPPLPACVPSAAMAAALRPLRQLVPGMWRAAASPAADADPIHAALLRRRRHVAAAAVAAPDNNNKGAQPWTLFSHVHYSASKRAWQADVRRVGVNGIFKTERACAAAVDEALIARGEEPVNARLLMGLERLLDAGYYEEVGEDDEDQMEDEDEDDDQLERRMPEEISEAEARAVRPCEG